MNVEQAALKIFDLKKTVSEALARGDAETSLDAFCEEIELKRKLRVQLAGEPIVSVQSEEANKVLREVRSGAVEEEKAIEAILSNVEDDGTCGLLIEDTKDIDALSLKLFYSWFSPGDYVLGLFRTGAVIVQCHVPSELREYVEEARQCFALSQHNAVFSMCRTIIESTVTDIAVHIGFVPKSEITKPDFYKNRRYSVWKRIDKVSAEPLRTEIHDLYHETSELLHARKTVGLANALGALKKTLHIAEKLYLQHHLLVKTPAK